jgi:hypothetical protein
MKIETILNIIQENYNKFKGTNEAELHASEEIFSLHSIETKELQEQLAEKTEALENSENGMLNLIKYKNELVEQLAAKEKELSEVKRHLENSRALVLDIDTKLINEVKLNVQLKSLNVEFNSEALRKHYEDIGYTTWINSDIYPDGRIYTKEYTEWIEWQLIKLNTPK